MTEKLENLTDEFNDFYIKDNYSHLKGPLLEDFTESIKDKKRRELIKKEVEDIFLRYFQEIKKNSPIHRRASLLEHAYNNVPLDDELNDRDSREILKQRLYDTPGRNYHYLNGILGEKRKSNDIKYELNNAAKYTLKEGWPVIGAGAGWWLANRWYKNQIKKGVTGRLKDSFSRKWWEYLMPGMGPLKGGADTGKFLAKEGIKGLWGLAKTPLLYMIGAYAAYKTAGYLLKRRREKKLEHEEIGALEKIIHEMRSQRDFVYNEPQFQLA